jgi:threonine dehydratase
MVTILDVLAARRLLAAYLPPTPTWSYPALNAVAGVEVHVKHENIQPTGAFKVRGGLTLLAGLPAAERAVVTFSTGNHAQSVAYAARTFGAPCVVVMPEGANEAKVRSVRALGGEVVLHGAVLADSEAYAEKLAADRGMRLVSPGDEPAVLAGVGTVTLELFESAPPLDTVLVPVGSGTGAAAACLVAAAVSPGTRVVAVQSSASPAAHDSWRAGEPVERPNRTAVEGLATGRAFALTYQVMREHLSDFVLVEDDEIYAAQRLLATHAHTLAEGAGAAALAAVLRGGFTGRVGIICTGGNASAAEIAGLG